MKLTDGREYTGLQSMELIHKAENFYDELETIYAQYYSSIPSKCTQFSRNNFVAKDLDHLSLSELVNGIPRVEAQYKLEAFVLLQAMAGQIPWENAQHFYWQSAKNRKLVVYKEWI